MPAAKVKHLQWTAQDAFARVGVEGSIVSCLARFQPYATVLSGLGQRQQHLDTGGCQVAKWHFNKIDVVDVRSIC